VQISAKTDYAVRALLSLAAREPELVKIDTVVTEQGMPRKFVEAILGELRRASIVRSQRGAEGGFMLAKPADEITVADIIRAVEGPLASVRGGPPEEAAYSGSAEILPRVWIAVRANLRGVVENVSLADIAGGKLPSKVDRLAADPEAWVTR
jgi:Rrf2 family protein